MRSRFRVRGFRTAAALASACAMQVVNAPVLEGQASAASEQRTVARAERLRAAGRPAEASAALREHLDRAPASPAALALFGELALETGEARTLVHYAEAALAAAPEDQVARLWWTRALTGADMPDSALAVTERWLADGSGRGEARLARADVQLAVGDSAGAARTLGGALVPSRELLTRLADILLASSDGDRVAAAWAELLALSPPETDEVEQDLRRVGEAGEAHLDRLWERLRGRTDDAARAGAIIALRLGDPAQARELADGVRGAGDIEDAAFLREYVREADAVALSAEIAWAAQLLAELSPRPVDRLRWQALAAEQSLVAGDTGAARRALEDLTRESDPGDGPHQLASRRLFGLLAAESASLDAAAAALDRYVRQYPDSTLAEASMRGQLALGHARAGELVKAEAVLSEARTRLRVASTGPLDAAAARLSLYAGRRDSAHERARRSVREVKIEAAERTRRLELLTLVQTADTAEVRIVGAAALGLLADPEAFDPGPALRDLAGAPASSGRPVVLAFLADEAAATGRHRIAEALRRQVVERHPASPQAPAALLDLARAAPPPEAALWLERLIVGYPRSALAPVARRLLTELDGGL
ncbi:hypothetical protein [Candidatus Palauibacter sp.]|uniref:hypothetical protein n=1 Tax=Candidatus Palauibacter sp. TaxID=3101350 RepID=UPI003B5CF30B